ncbi:hypothetical protein GCM10022226_16450 [Sphaerisporangium flaviroseum]|uniref:Uncharacterized protein n=1 Tax=Sphaerisporangium flaviroseum TaxID=509199 RepID=A0ABP7HNF3_9ACTN
MTIFGKFTPSARQAMVEAGLLAADAGHDLLDEDLILLALAKTRPFDEPLGGFDLTTEAVRTAMTAAGGGAVRPHDRELLATLGIDLDEVRRRASGLARVDDPARWTLFRSRWRPLAMILSGPAHDLVLTGRARKVVEVAMNWHGSTGRVTGEDLLRGLLADGSNRSVRIMGGNGVDLRRLATDLRFLRTAA